MAHAPTFTIALVRGGATETHDVCPSLHRTHAHYAVGHFPSAALHYHRKHLRQVKAKAATVSRPKIVRGKLTQSTDSQNENVPTKKNKITGVLLIIIGFTLLSVIMIDWIIYPTTLSRPIDFTIILIAIGIILIICGVTYLVRTPVNRRDSWPRTLPYT